MRIHAYICMHACMYIYMLLPVNISTYIHVDVCADVSRCVYVCAYVSMHTFVLLMLHACELFRNRYTLTTHPTSSTPNIHNTICPLPCRRARDSFAGATGMDSDQRTPMASPVSHVASKYDLHPHAMHANPTHLHDIIPSCCRCDTESIPACTYMYLYVYAYLCAYMHIFACMYVRIFTCRCL